MKTRCGRSGFTLIELLVVIAIIAILAAILFPVFISAREKAKQSTCFNNQKQIGTGLMMYVDDYSTYVYVDSSQQGPWSWPNRMMRYIRNRRAFKCPSDTSPPPVGANIRNTPASYRKDMCSYSYNSQLVGRKTSELNRASKVIFLEDTWYPSATDGVYYHLVDMANWGYGFDMDGSRLNLISLRHSSGANFLFADGHSGWKKVFDVVGTAKPPVPYRDWNYPPYNTQNGISYIYNYRG